MNKFKTFIRLFKTPREPWSTHLHVHNDNAKGPDTPNWDQRTSGNKGWLLRRLMSPVSGLKKCTWTHCKDYHQLAYTLCACVRGNTSPYRREAKVCICHLNGETWIFRTADIQKVTMIKPHLPLFSDHSRYYSHLWSRIYLIKKSCRWHGGRGGIYSAQTCRFLANIFIIFLV